MAYRVSKPHFYDLVEQAIASLPEQFSRFLEEVPVEVRDTASPQQRQAAGLENDSLLLGLYHGRPITTRSVENSGTMPDVIYIFQEDIQRSCDSEQSLIEQVRITVLHEIGHLFGLDEADLEKLGYR